MKNWMMSCAVAALLVSCGPVEDATQIEVPEIQSAELGPWGLEVRHISESVHPGNNFYTYVNEGWLVSTPIPTGFSSISSWNETYLRTEAQVDAIILDVVAGQGAVGSPEQQIAALYRSFMDTDAVEAAGIEPLREELDGILASSSHADIARWMARPFQATFVNYYIGLDSGDTSRYIVNLYQDGLGMPDRDYYLDEGETFVAYRSAYVDFITSLMTSAGIDAPRERAEAVLAIETRIATAHWTVEDSRDDERNYDLQTIEQLQAYAPEFPWVEFLDSAGLGEAEEVVVMTNTALRDSARAFGEISVADWSSYLAFHYIDAQNYFLGTEYRDANFNFYSRTLYGVEEQRPRELRVVPMVSVRLDEHIGRLYVERHFPEESKTRLEEYFAYMRRAFAERLSSLEWMDEPTRVEALAKLDAFTTKIGHQDRWMDYSALDMRDDDLLGNNRRIVEWEIADDIARLSEPPRDWEWFTSPQTVNCWYRTTANEIVFPAAILQPPFFDINADAAVNFGAVGAFIGHEMGHGFDDQGSRSDGDGILRNWWTDASRAQFDTRANRLARQYDGYEPLEGETVNGDFTLGENIGDLGGVSLAHRAYQLYLEDHGGGETLDGFTPDQRFFMAWAQISRVVQTDDSLIARLRSDPHSPGEFRSNGVVRNLDAWYEAFGVTEEHDMYLPPEERVSIW